MLQTPAEKGLHFCHLPVPRTYSDISAAINIFKHLPGIIFYRKCYLPMMHNLSLPSTLIQFPNHALGVVYLAVLAEAIPSSIVLVSYHRY